MRKLWIIFILALLLALPSLALAQGTFVGPFVSFKVVNGLVMPNAGATITVCAASAGGIPCSPALANRVYSNQALTQPLSNPFPADPNGNYSFAISPGNYTVTETATGFAGKSFQVSVGVAPGSSGALYFLDINGVTLAPGDTVDWNATTPVVPTNGVAVAFATSKVGTTDFVSAAVVGDGNAAHFLNGLGGFGVPYILPAQYALVHCQGLGLGDGYNAIPAETYPMFGCHNDSAVTWTILGISCFTDNNGTSTLAAADNAATALLTGAITCTNVKSTGGAPGTLGSTITLAPGDGITFSFVADGTTKTTSWSVLLSQ